MIEITASSIYVPRYRLARETIAQAWGAHGQSGSKAAGSKAVSNFDEDALTMGVAAAWPLGPQAPDRLYFASTSSPYWQRSAASQIVAACDWGPETASVEFGGSLRSGFSALIAAVEAIGSNNAAGIIVTAADRRDAVPESAEELVFGDAAAAIRIASKPGAAEIVAYVSRSDDFLDEWRRDADLFVRNYSSKYSVTRGYEVNVLAAAKAVLAKAGVESSQVAVFAVNSLDGRSHSGCAKALAIPADRVCDGWARDIGVTGAAMPLLALAQAIGCAKPGELILAIAYGDGADAILLRATAAPAVPHDPGHTAAIAYGSYSRYRKSREYLRQDEGGPDISNVLWKNEETQNVRLHGTKCSKCSAVQFPITRVCTACRNSEGLVEVPLGRTGRLFTFTKDYLYDAPALPTVMAVIDLDGGGRFMCQMTDVDESEVRIGMPVKLVLRRLREGGRNHHYYWKCRPA